MIHNRGLLGAAINKIKGVFQKPIKDFIPSEDPKYNDPGAIESWEAWMNTQGLSEEAKEAFRTQIQASGNPYMSVRKPYMYEDIDVNASGDFGGGPDIRNVQKYPKELDPIFAQTPGAFDRGTGAEPDTVYQHAFTGQENIGNLVRVRQNIYEKGEGNVDVNTPLIGQGITHNEARGASIDMANQEMMHAFIENHPELHDLLNNPDVDLRDIDFRDIMHNTPVYDETYRDSLKQAGIEQMNLPMDERYALPEDYQPGDPVNLEAFTHEIMEDLNRQALQSQTDEFNWMTRNYQDNLLTKIYGEGAKRKSH